MAVRSPLRGEKLKKADELLRQNEALRDRLSRLSEAGLRITEDLDLDSVLQGIVDAARSLTGASMGGVTTLDDSGQLQDYAAGLRAPAAGERPSGCRHHPRLSRLPRAGSRPTHGRTGYSRAIGGAVKEGV